ncbi:MAG: hypothetical protein R3300_22060 [Candidatus Promineifilaceae bacterium]|nr:hypothetical protein [Candidatus Promineifilaceae bacterium]
MNSLDTPQTANQLRRPLLMLLAPLMLAVLSCAFLTELEAPTPTAEPVVEDAVKFLVPLYTTSLAPGESVPGTQMTFVSRQGDTYNVTIDGLAAAKRVGDSFAWRGVIAPGVVADFNLRISPTFRGDSLLAGGPVEISVLNPAPVELPPTAVPVDVRLHFSKIAVENSVAIGERIPGTTLIFAGRTEQGAELTGTSGYPYRALGDSLIWTGRLRGDVVVRYSLRVAGLDEDHLRVLGTAELWITSGS